MKKYSKACDLPTRQREFSGQSFRFVHPVCDGSHLCFLFSTDYACCRLNLHSSARLLPLDPARAGSNALLEDWRTFEKRQTDSIGEPKTGTPRNLKLAMALDKCFGPVLLSAATAGARTRGSSHCTGRCSPAGFPQWQTSTARASLLAHLRRAASRTTQATVYCLPTD